MRGLVLKSHWEPTASLVYLVRKEVPASKFSAESI